MPVEEGRQRPALDEWVQRKAVPPEGIVWQHLPSGAQVVQWEAQESWDVYALKVSADPLRRGVAGLQQAMRFAEQLGSRQHG